MLEYRRLYGQIRDNTPLEIPLKAYEQWWWSITEPR
jgi:hypothetical protein